MNHESIAKALLEAGRPEFWGTIEIDYQNGAPVVLRVTKTEKLYEQRTTRSYVHNK